jgi:hypothetical protein
MGTGPARKGDRRKFITRTQKPSPKKKNNSLYNFQRSPFLPRRDLLSTQSTALLVGAPVLPKGTSVVFYKVGLPSSLYFSKKASASRPLRRSTCPLP